MWGFCFWLMPADASSTLQNSRGEDVALLVIGVLSCGFYIDIYRLKNCRGYSSLCVYREREVIIEEGSRTNLDFMVWVLDGEATLESFAGGGASQPVTVNVLSAGSAVGIMSLVDSEPRSLRVVASMPMVCAMLTRTQLQKLCQEQPQIGIKLMAALCLVFSQTLRSLTTKFKCHVRLNNVLNAELQGQESAIFQLDERL